MEFISPEQLQKYQDVIQQINCEYQRQEELKRKLVDESNAITIINFSNSNITEKISHVDLEIYSDITDLLDVYSADIRDVDDLLPCKGTKYYLVKVFITTALLQKLGNKKWLLNLCITNDNVYISRSVHLVNKMPIITVIPVNDNIIDSTLECNLTSSCKEPFLSIELSKTFIDISFHFRTHKKNQIILDYKSQKVLEIYKSNFPDLSSSQLDIFPICEYSFECDMESNTFKQNMMMNCYHNLGIDQFMETGDELTIQLACKYGKLIVTKKAGKLHLRSNINDLYHLKIFFSKFLQKSRNKKKQINLSKLKNTVAYSSNVQEVYREVRKLWSTL